MSKKTIKNTIIKKDEHFLLNILKLVEGEHAYMYTVKVNNVRTEEDLIYISEVFNWPLTAENRFTWWKKQCQKDFTLVFQSTCFNPFYRWSTVLWKIPDRFKINITLSIIVTSPFLIENNPDELLEILKWDKILGSVDGTFKLTFSCKNIKDIHKILDPILKETVTNGNFIDVRWNKKKEFIEEEFIEKEFIEAELALPLEKIAIVRDIIRDQKFYAWVANTTLVITIRDPKWW